MGWQRDRAARTPDEGSAEVSRASYVVEPSSKSDREERARLQLLCLIACDVRI